MLTIVLEVFLDSYLSQCGQCCKKEIIIIIRACDAFSYLRCPWLRCCLFTCTSSTISKNNCTVQISQLFTFCGFKNWNEIPPSFPKNWRKTLDFQAQILEHPFCGTNINIVCTICLTFTVTNDCTYYLNFAIISLCE